MIENGSIQIWGLNINDINYDSLYHSIKDAILNRAQIIISYSNAHILNALYKNEKLTSILNKFDIIHPDGIGIFMASRFLFKKNGLKQRISGSDFYPYLIENCIRDNFSIFFLGHDDMTLNEIKFQNVNLQIAGIQN